MRPAFVPNAHLDTRIVHHASAIDIKVGDEIQVNVICCFPKSRFVFFVAQVYGTRTGYWRDAIVAQSNVDDSGKSTRPFQTP